MSTSHPRRPIATQLGLNRDSKLPNFAKDLTLEQLQNYPDLLGWEHYRSLLQKGIYEMDDVPFKYQPQREGSFKFADDILSTSGIKQSRSSVRDRLSSQVRRAKLKFLGLHGGSACPAFAFGLSIEDVKKHKDLPEWHRYLELLQNEKISYDDLPVHFQTLKGALRFKTTAAEERERLKRKMSNSMREESMSKKTKSSHEERLTPPFHESISKQGDRASGPISELHSHAHKLRYEDGSTIGNEQWSGFPPIFH